jgi:hypothetical protein
MNARSRAAKSISTHHTLEGVDKVLTGMSVNTPTVTPSRRTVTAMYLRNLNIDQLTKAHEAADYLLGLPARLDAELSVKLDTLRADLMAAIEDSEPARLRQP